MYTTKLSVIYETVLFYEVTQCTVNFLIYNLNYSLECHSHHTGYKNCSCQYLRGAFLMANFSALLLRHQWN